MEFKKGDRVKLLRDIDYAKEGMIGTIMTDYSGYRYGYVSIAVEFDEEFLGGHTCAGLTKEGRGHWIYPYDMELLDSPHAFTLVITSKGDHTEAKFLRGKEIIKTAEVNRYKDDEYSQPAAIHAIVNKMFPEDFAGVTRDEPEPEEPPKFTGKAVCLKTDDLFTKGRVYNFTNGHVEDDNGDQCLRALDDYEDWKEWFDNRFIAIVEDNKA